MAPQESGRTSSEGLFVFSAPSMRAVKGSLATPLKRGLGIRRASPGLMARPGKSIAKQSEGRAGEKYLPVGGRVRKLRHIDQHVWPSKRGKASELEMIN